MKRICIIITALALALGFAQCKKSTDTDPTTEGVKITLSVDDGSKVDVNPGTGTVTFQDGDVIYVGSGGNYVGSLTRTSGVFTGDITDPVEGEPLYFYFLGNVTPTIDGNLFTVSIANQTSSLPVISCGTSTKNYSSTITSYSSKLKNKCALVKFNVTTSSSSATCINGFNNKLSIDFSTNTMTPSKEGMGGIVLASGNGEKWAILLPQDAIEAGSAYSVGYPYSDYTGTRGAVPSINENDYLSSGITVTVTTSNYVDLGLPSGTLWATFNVGAHVPEEYGSYYAWGETQAKTTYDRSTYKYCNGYTGKLTKYCNNSSYGYQGFTDNLTTLLPEDDAATVNWGGEWRMPTQAEWQELSQNTESTWTTQNGIYGRLVTASNGNSLFLPAGGYYSGSDLYKVNSEGYYWSSSLYTGQPELSTRFIITSFGLGTSNGYRTNGISVRAVRTQNSYYLIEATASPTEGGAVSGGGYCLEGSECILTASPNAGYSFTNWTENDEVVSTSSEYSFTVIANRNLEANFSALSYSIDISANPSNGGVVSGGGSFNYGQNCTVSAVANNGYIFANWTENGNVVSNNPNYTFAVNSNRILVANFTIPPASAIKGLFTVNSSGDQVYFSQGNLQYVGSAGSPYWRFAENQWDYLGNNGQGGSSQTVDRDLFGWGTSGFNHGANCYQPWSTSETNSDYYAYGQYNYNLYDQSGMADWGRNPIINGGNQSNQWRTLTKDEWDYIINYRKTPSGVRWVQAKVNNVNGMILLPDDWSTTYYHLNYPNVNSTEWGYNPISATTWSELEQHGAVFLPASGGRWSGGEISFVTSLYWSSSCYDADQAWVLNFGNSTMIPGYKRNRFLGGAVRLVRDVE